MTRATETHADSDPSAVPKRALTVSLNRVRRGRAVAFAPTEPTPAPPQKPRPSRAAQMLALAHEFQRLIDDGEVPDRATLAAQVGLTRARVTQILDLLLLAPDIQEEVLGAQLAASDASHTERQLRGLARVTDWNLQRHLAAGEDRQQEHAYN